MDATNLGIHPTSPMAIKLAKANRLNHAFIWRGGEAVEAYSGIIKAAPLGECQDRRASEFHLKYHRELSYSVRARFAFSLEAARANLAACDLYRLRRENTGVNFGGPGKIFRT